MDEDAKGRTIAVKLPRKYYRAVRRLAAEYELANAEVLVWAIDLLERHHGEPRTHSKH